MDYSADINMIGGRPESYDIVNHDDGIGRRVSGTKSTFLENDLKKTSKKKSKTSTKKTSTKKKSRKESVKKENIEYEYFYIKTGELVRINDYERIRKMGLPPAWTNVWISKDPDTNIQAVGIDSKGRKQYRYSQSHVEQAEKKKFLKLIDFIAALPKLDHAIEMHSKSLPTDKSRVIVTMLLIVKELNMRVGKEQYARENKSYGVSSLKKTHVTIKDDLIQFNFKGKSNKRLSYSMRSELVAKHILELLDLPGEKLFQYVNDNGNAYRVTDRDLNDFLQFHMGENFTVKDFRTYAANFYFIRSLINETKKNPPITKQAIKKNIINSLQTTAKYLKHTKSISKKSYVMNFCIEMYEKDPEWFMKRKSNKIDNILLELLDLYKLKIKNSQ